MLIYVMPQDNTNKHVSEQSLYLFRPGGSFLPAAEIIFNNSMKNKAIIKKLFDN